MALSQYVLLVSLSAGIHAHGDANGVSIGPEAITQPNGTRVAAQVDFFKKSLNTAPVNSYQSGGHGHVPSCAGTACASGKHFPTLNPTIRPNTSLRVK